MDNLFSHAPLTPKPPAPTSYSHAAYTQLKLPFEEIWEGFTGYPHLWWPPQFRVQETSHIDLSPHGLHDQTEDGTNTLLATTNHWAPGDVIALQPLEDAGPLYHTFPQGLSFTFDIGDDTQPTIIDITGGILPPADLAHDAELGITSQQIQAARDILTAFSRFMGQADSVHIDRP